VPKSLIPCLPLLRGKNKYGVRGFSPLLIREIGNKDNQQAINWPKSFHADGG